MGQRRTDAEIVAAYEAAGSVWKAAEALGMVGQTVHKRLKAIGAAKPIRVFTPEEMARVEALYREGFKNGDGKLGALAKELGRTKPFVCRQAKAAGLTNQSRQFCDELKAKVGEKAKDRWQRQPHPRGALGMKHGFFARAAMSRAGRERWKAMTPDEQAAATTKQLLGKLAKSGTLAPPRHKVSWKQGWREVGGRRIYFRSRWEHNYAVFLQYLKDNGQIREWEHEPETFWFDAIKRGCRSYLPDYRVTEMNGDVIYHEVKGWMCPRSKTKLKRMKKYHPKVSLRVIDGKWFKENGPKLSFLPGWESGK